jgi:protein TonB
LLLEGLLLLLLLSLGRADAPEDETVTFVDLKAVAGSESESEPPDSAAPEPEAAELAAPRPAEAEAEAELPPRLAEAQAAPAVLPPVPSAREPDPRYGVGPRPIQRPPPAGPAFGPAGSGSSGDTARVGTAPNGEPLYAAAWYREPYDDELRGYLSTATGPGWGLIACRTAPDYRVEDCVGLDEYPRGSMIMRSVLAAAWQFKVRPPRLGGRPQIGEWVRIRIDYETRTQLR